MIHAMFRTLRPAATSRPWAAGKAANPARRKEAVWGLVMVAPMMIGWTIFFLIGFIGSFGISLTSWKLLGTPTFVGSANYTRLIGDERFLMSLGNTLRLATIYVPLDLVVAVSLAVVLNRRIPFRNVYRAIFFLPLLTMPIAAATVWRWLYSPTYGLINAGLEGIHINGPAWLAEPLWAMPAIVVMIVWNGVGRDMVIFLAGLQAIPRDLYEAAEIDGASHWQTFRRITLPLLTPTTFFVTVVSTISSLQVFDAIYVMTNGGPGNSTRTVVFTVWEEAFRNYRIGYASAMTWALVILILGFTLLQFRVQRRWVHYS
jgi:multiple sugar transport system permease protein